MRLIVAVGMLMLIGFTATAGADGGGVCPEFANSISAMRKSGGPSVDLVLEKASAKQKKRGLYRGWDQSVQLEGPKAKVAVRGSASFAFKPMNPKVNPNQQIKLYPFKTEKGKRSLIVGGMSNWGGTKKKNANDDSIGLEFKKISDGCYKVTPIAELPSGQYAFSLGSDSSVQGNTTFQTTATGQTWFGFGVP